jgi:hypothetical protein
MMEMHDAPGAMVIAMAGRRDIASMLTGAAPTR